MAEKKIIILKILFALIVIIMLTPAVTKSADVAQMAIIITAEQLYEEYEENEVAADLKYKNKLLQVTGIVKSIGKTIGDKPYISLQTGAFSSQVTFYFPSETYNEKLATLKKGTTIKIKGICKGKSLGIVVINVE